MVKAMIRRKKTIFTIAVVFVLIVGCIAFSGVRSFTTMDTTVRWDAVKENTFNYFSSLTNAKVIPNRGGGHPVVIPSTSKLENMTRNDLEELYFSYIENLQTHCIRQHHCGNENDGGYHICEDVFDATKPCLMYSFGNRKDFSFDDAVASRYGCTVHSFDPYDKQVDHVHSPKVTFHSLGISGKDIPEKRLLTVGTIKQKFNHTQKIDILKIDVEGAEWDSLEEMCRGRGLEEVKLLIVEFHVCVVDCYDGNHRLKRQYVRYLSTLRRIYDFGFRIYFFRMWPFCHAKENGVDRTTCHEVHMMKVT